MEPGLCGTAVQWARGDPRLTASGPLSLCLLALERQLEGVFKGMIPSDIEVGNFKCE